MRIEVTLLDGKVITYREASLKHLDHCVQVNGVRYDLNHNSQVVVEDFYPYGQFSSVSNILRYS